MAHPDLDQLLNALLPTARELLAEHGEFRPFASSIALGGDLVSEAAYDGNEDADSQTIIEMLTQVLRQRATSGRLRAAGVCFDARIALPGESEIVDAICVGLEHQLGQAVNVYLPYKKDQSGKIQNGELVAARRTPQFFVLPDLPV